MAESQCIFLILFIENSSCPRRKWRISCSLSVLSIFLLSSAWLFVGSPEASRFTQSCTIMQQPLNFGLDGHDRPCQMHHYHRRVFITFYIHDIFLRELPPSNYSKSLIYKVAWTMWILDFHVFGDRNNVVLMQLLFIPFCFWGIYHRFCGNLPRRYMILSNEVKLSVWRRRYVRKGWF